MRALRCGIAALPLLAALLAFPAAATPGRPEELHPGPLDFTPLEVDHDTLRCGIPVYMFVNHDLPLLDLSIRFRMGTRYVNAGEQAAVSLLSDVWRSGGTESLDPAALDERLAALDASMSSWVGSRSGGIWLYSSSVDADETLPLWRDVIRHPRFDGDRLEKARANEIKDLQGMNDDPATLAETHWDWLLYGRDYPGAHVETRAEVESVTAEALERLYRRFVDPRNAVIGVSGDFDRADMLARLDALFSDWANPDWAGVPEKAPWPMHSSPGVYLLRGDFEQSHVRIGRLVDGLTRASPDYGAARVLSFAFGYGRTFYRTRQEGLSYGAAVFVNIGDESAAQYGFGSGRAEATTALLGALKGEMDELPDRPLDEEETERARVYLVGTQVRENETASALVSSRVANVVEGLPEDFDEMLLRRYQSTTAAEINRLAGRCYGVTDGTIVLVVGNPDAFGTPLDSLGLGPVTELEPVRFGE